MTGRDALARVAPQSLRRPLEHPRNDDGRYEADRERDDGDANRFITETEGREDRLDDLDDQPGRDDVRRRYAYDVTLL